MDLPADLPASGSCLVLRQFIPSRGTNNQVPIPSGLYGSILLEGRSCILLGTVNFSPSLLPAVTPRFGHKMLCIVAQHRRWASEVGFELAGPWVPQHETHVPVTVVMGRLGAHRQALLWVWGN